MNLFGFALVKKARGDPRRAPSVAKADCFRQVPLEYIPLIEYKGSMHHDVEYTNEFRNWWGTLTESEQEDVAATVGLLSKFGPQLPFPYSSGVEISSHGRMRELRVQSSGKPIRVFYAFDPRRMAVLLIGGHKTSEKRFYKQYVSLADKLYDEHLQELRGEGLIQ